MKKVVLLTDARTGKKVLIGVDSIIKTEESQWKDSNGKLLYPGATEIRSRSAMVETTLVVETPEEIYELSK